MVRKDQLMEKVCRLDEASSSDDEEQDLSTAHWLDGSKGWK